MMVGLNTYGSRLCSSKMISSRLKLIIIPIITGEGGSSGGERSPSPGPAAVASSMVNESELWMLQKENTRLKGECSELRGQLDQGKRERRTLEEQVKRLNEHTVSTNT